jgi:hypothetical protein
MEGCSRKSEAECKQFFELSQGFGIEVGTTAFDSAPDLQYTIKGRPQRFGIYSINLFKQLGGLVG